MKKSNLLSSFKLIGIYKQNHVYRISVVSISIVNHFFGFIYRKHANLRWTGNSFFSRFA